MDLLEPARWRQRDDPWVFLLLARALRDVRPPRNEDALRALTVATMLQPALGVELAEALTDTGRTVEAIDTLADLNRRRPNAVALYLLGEMQVEVGRSAEAKTSFARCVDLLRQQIELSPDNAEAYRTSWPRPVRLGRCGWGHRGLSASDWPRP